ncbi:hypothetical protein GQ457_10G013230 [Hibiscus cannabinus]
MSRSGFISKFKLRSTEKKHSISLKCPTIIVRVKTSRDGQRVVTYIFLKTQQKGQRVFLHLLNDFPRKNLIFPKPRKKIKEKCNPVTLEQIPMKRKGRKLKQKGSKISLGTDKILGTIHWSSGFTGRTMCQPYLPAQTK